MAKLQGHFLKYRDQPQAAIDNARDLLDMEFHIKDMSIYEWLRRLNFHKFAPQFRKHGIKRVSDLKHLNDGVIMQAGITGKMHRIRLMKMAQGDDVAKQMFGLQTKSQARTLLA